MENFITGFPGHEHEMRAAMLEVLGPDKYSFFFDKVELAPRSPLPVVACAAARRETSRGSRARSS